VSSSPPLSLPLRKFYFFFPPFFLAAFFVDFLEAFFFFAMLSPPLVHGFERNSAPMKTDPR
jgi:hypothetical protein